MGNKCLHIAVVCDAPGGQQQAAQVVPRDSTHPSQAETSWSKTFLRKMLQGSAPDTTMNNPSLM